MLVSWVKFVVLVGVNFPPCGADVLAKGKYRIRSGAFSQYRAR